MRDHIRTVIGLGLAVGLMALFLRNADFASGWSEIRSARLDLVGGALVAIAVSYAFRVRRWQQLLGPIGQVSILAAWRATAIGFATTAVLPGRLGEVLRPYLLARPTLDRVALALRLEVHPHHTLLVEPLLHLKKMQV